MQRQVGGGQRDTHAAAGEHHHHLRRMQSFLQELGVSGEGDAGVVDDPLVHRCRCHCIKQAVAATVGGDFQRAQHVAAVGGVQASGSSLFVEGNMQHRERRRRIAIDKTRWCTGRAQFPCPGM